MPLLRTSTAATESRVLHSSDDQTTTTTTITTATAEGEAAVARAIRGGETKRPKLKPPIISTAAAATAATLRVSNKNPPEGATMTTSYPTSTNRSPISVFILSIDFNVHRFIV